MYAQGKCAALISASLSAELPRSREEDRVGKVARVRTDCSATLFNTCPYVCVYIKSVVVSDQVSHPGHPCDVDGFVDSSINHRKVSLYLLKRAVLLNNRGIGP